MRLIVAAAAVGAITLAAADRAHAQVLTIRISQGSSTFPGGPDIVGGLTFASSSGTLVVGDYRIMQVSASSNNPGSTANTFLNLNSLTVTRVSSSSTDPLVILASETGFTAPLGQTDWSASYTANWARSVMGDSATFNSWVENNGALFSTAGTSAGGSQTLTSPGGVSISQSVAPPGVSVTLTNPFTITTQVSIVTSVGGTTVINLNSTNQTSLSAVPEPATTAMALSGLPVAGLFWALRRRKRA